MRILHTSDWHIGRSFHGHSTVENLRIVLEDLVHQACANDVDVVIVAGDIYDSVMPAAEYLRVFESIMQALADAGIQVIVTSGNHDSAVRLGYGANWAKSRGIHVCVDARSFDEPIVISDEHGPVRFYPIAYLEPVLVRQFFEGVDDGQDNRTQAGLYRQVMAAIAAREAELQAAGEGARHVAIAHCFAVGVDPSAVEASDIERDITAGGLDYVPVSVFEGPDYVALGHIHSAAVLAEHIRYSGSTLHYSFTEAGKSRGAWLVDLDGEGLASAQWLDLVVPRQVRVLRGNLDELLGDSELAAVEGDWVAAVLTDQVRPIDAISRLQSRFPGCVRVTYEPTGAAEEGSQSYRQRLVAKTETEVMDDFLGFVRSGAGASDVERELIGQALDELDAERLGR